LVLANIPTYSLHSFVIRRGVSTAPRGRLIYAHQPADNIQVRPGTFLNLNDGSMTSGELATPAGGSRTLANPGFGQLHRDAQVNLPEHSVKAGIARGIGQSFRGNLEPRQH